MMFALATAREYPDQVSCLPTEGWVDAASASEDASTCLEKVVIMSWNASAAVPFQGASSPPASAFACAATSGIKHDDARPSQPIW